MVKLSDMRIGSKVMVRGCFGVFKPELVLVTDIDEDIKNGEPGIGYESDKTGTHWAYLEQVDSVVEY